MTSTTILNKEATNPRKIVPCIPKRHFSVLGIAREQEEVVKASFPALAINEGPVLVDEDGAEEESSKGRAFAPIRKIGQPGIRWLNIVGHLKHIDLCATGTVDRIVERERQFEAVAECK